MGSYYSYEQFEKALKDSGYKLSEADMAIAKSNPDVGMSLLQYGKDYNSATTSEAKELAHQGAEALRKKYGQYRGGTDGSGFYVDPNAAPVYKDSYAEKKKELMDAILNRKDFTYDPGKDPTAQSYEKQYAREGKRATDNVMASAAAATGGMPSSFAVSAAAQAGNQYAAKMADKIPELEQMAYNRYLQDLNLKHSDLQMVNGASKTEYDQFLNSLNQYNNDRNFEHMQNQDKLAQQNADRNFEYVQSQDKLDREYQQRQEQLKMALIKAENGDYSGLKELGVDTSKMESRMIGGSGGGYRSGGRSRSSGYGDSADAGDTGARGSSGGGVSTKAIDSLLAMYPDGMIPSADWDRMVRQYGASTLINGGFQRKIPGGKGEWGKNIVKEEIPRNKYLSTAYRGGLR